MTVRTQVIGSDRLARKLRAIPQQERAELGRAVRASALLVQGEAKRTIQSGTRSGRPYVRYNPRRTGIASAPGEPPKTDTGRLANSVDFDIDADDLGASVGTNLTYGRHLEFGTRKMAARPWLFPTFERLKRRITRRVAQATATVLRRNAR